MAGDSTPSYQWFVNNTPVGDTVNSFAYAPENGDSVVCVLLTTGLCNTIRSNTVKITDTGFAPAIHVVASPGDTICGKIPVTFIAVSVSGGTSPAYQWIVNGVPIASSSGGGDTIYTYIPDNGDSVRCVLTASGDCMFAGTYGSNSIHMVVDTPVVPNINISGPASASIGSTVTFTAAITPAVTGSYSIEWFDNGVLFATTSEPTVTYTKADSTDSIMAEIVPAAFCYDSSLSVVQIVGNYNLGINGLSNETIVVHPNPFGREIIIEGPRLSSYSIQNMMGQTVLQGQLGQGTNTIGTRTIPSGVYILSISGEDGRKTIRKIIKE